MKRKKPATLPSILTPLFREINLKIYLASERRSNKVENEGEDSLLRAK